MSTYPPFGEFDSSYDESRIVILPVPYDGTSTWIKGADRGPQAMLQASANLEFYDIETDSEVYRHGICTLPPVNENRSPELMTEAVNRAALEHIRNGKFVVTFGGEHSVSVGSVFAHAESFPNMSVLQLDAHSDLRPEYMGSKFNHACVMSRIKEVSPAVQVGIRSMDSSELPFMDKERVFFAENIHSGNDWITRVLSLLTENVYITIDLDVFDPAFLPATGTPEPGGMGWYQVMDLLRAAAETKNIIGFDVVELCPIPGDRRSDFFAAKLIYKLLSYKFHSNKRQL